MPWPVAPSNLDLKVSERSSLRLHSVHRAGGSFPTPLKAPALGLFESVAAVASADPALEETKGEAHAPCWIDGSDLRVELRGGASATLTSLFAAEISCAPLNVADCEGLHLMALVPPLGDGGLRATSAGGSATTGAPVWYLVFDRDHVGQAQLQRELCRLGCCRTDFHRVYKALPGERTVFGHGANARVKRMFDRDGRVAAVKMMNPSAKLDDVQREAATLLTVQAHSNVIDYVGMFWTRAESPRPHLVLAAATGGDVLRRVGSEGALPEAEARELFAGATRGLQHIHGKGVVHRDVKAENILISGNENEERAQLADFGLATFLSDEVQMARRCGTPGYVAPEVCLGSRYGSNVDVFGMGVVLHYMLSKALPFAVKDGDDRATMWMTVECHLRLRKPLWESHSASLRSMLRSTICKDPEERLSAAGALSHLWMRTSSSGRAKIGGEEKLLGAAEQVELKSAAQHRQPSVKSTADSWEVLPHHAMPARYPTPMVHPKFMCPKLSERPPLAT